MTLQEHLVVALQSNLDRFKATLADFSDADLLVRPVPGANHAAWQIGHLISSERRLVETTKPSCMPPLPAGFAEKFTKETAAVDTPSAFPSKAELLAAYDQQRQGTIAWAKGLTEAELDQPLPPPIGARIPTVAALALLVPTHLAMHMGQIQVIRRKLNKPVLF